MEILEQEKQKNKDIKVMIAMKTGNSAEYAGTGFRNADLQALSKRHTR